MFAWLSANWGNLLVGGILLAVLTAIAVSALRRKGSGGCCCGCTGCDRNRDGECGRERE